MVIIAAILWNRGEESIINTWLVGQTTYTSAAAGAGTMAIPAASSDWHIGLGAGGRSAGTATSSKTTQNGSTVATQIAEIGVSTAAGYTRQAINRSTSGWPQATLSTNMLTTPASASSFAFSGAPSYGDVTNPATLWFVCIGTVLNTSDHLFGADLAANRIFAASDTERVTPTFKQT